MEGKHWLLLYSVFCKFNINVSVHFSHSDVYFLGLRRSQSHTPSWGAGVYRWRKSPKWHHSRQTAIPWVGKPVLNTKLQKKKPDAKWLVRSHSSWVSTLLLVLQAQDLQIVCYAFTAFGKAAIKQKKLHPDTFVQLAMQLAYQKMYKRYGLVKNGTIPSLMFKFYKENGPKCLFLPLTGQEVVMRQQWLASSTTAGRRRCAPAPRRLWTGIKPWWTPRVMWVCACLKPCAVAKSQRGSRWKQLMWYIYIFLSGWCQEESHAAGLQ